MGGRAVVYGMMDPYYPRAILHPVFDISYCSLPVVSLTTTFDAMVMALQIYTGISRFEAEIAATIEDWPAFIDLNSPRVLREVAVDGVDACLIDQSMGEVDLVLIEQVP